MGRPPRAIRASPPFPWRTLFRSCRLVTCVSLLGQLGRDLGHVAALEARRAKLLLARLAAAVAAGDGVGAVGRPADNLVESHLIRRTVRQADDYHALVQQGGVEGGQRGFLAAVLGGGGGEDATHLAESGPLDPQAAGQVEQIATQRGPVAEAGPSAASNGCAGDRSRRPGGRR